jgi:hypothetical protein
VSEEKEDGCAAALSKVALLLGGGFFRVYAITVLWRWFAVPLGIPAVGFWHVCGIGVLLGALYLKTYDPTERERSMAWENVCNVALSGPLSLGLGWLYLRLAF